MKQTSKIRTGMGADEVLKLRGRSEDFIVQNPRVLGYDGRGLIVKWFYRDCTVTLRRDGKVYRVAEIEDQKTAAAR